MFLNIKVSWLPGHLMHECGATKLQTKYFQHMWDLHIRNCWVLEMNSDHYFELTPSISFDFEGRILYS